ncbi:hypothetical protein QWZ03_14440 [Chitinimonas viridis]|uniref:Uncharacterized protein n=1 Tax=Chitinimonas viridis TaxID=664880 RepID=A0ABT8B7H1_9NEIS|nr:hypothetical protein [Chitinimonas viridis]MDN3577965.1 hypothetical protein [Chitinimonas viridis]
MSDDDMNTHALLLSDPVNFAVVQLPDRKFPGVVCQGDTLNSLVQALDSMMQALKDRDLDEVEGQIRNMREVLSSAQTYYESVCLTHEMDLPYLK